MPTWYLIEPVGVPDPEGYWIEAASEEEARDLLVMNGGPELHDADDPEKFSCRVDDSQKPPRSLAYCRHRKPVAILR